MDVLSQLSDAKLVRGILAYTVKHDLLEERHSGWWIVSYDVFHERNSGKEQVSAGDVAEGHLPVGLGATSREAQDSALRAHV